MRKWTKENALKELDALSAEIMSVASAGRNSAEHVRWVMNTGEFLKEVFGTKSSFYTTFVNFTWSAQGSFFIEGWDPEAEIQERHRLNFLQQLEMAGGILQAAKDKLEKTSIDSVYQGKDTAPESSALVKIINIAEGKLRKVIRDTPTTERQIQEAFESLLIGADIPYSRETDSIEYSSKTYTPDFTIKQLDLAIEIKYCARSGREKEMIAEINDDILAYQTRYGNLFFVIYDVGQIRDSDKFASSLQENENVIVCVIKH